MAELPAKKRDSAHSPKGRVMIGFSYSPAAHAAVKQLVVSAEIVLADRITELTGGPDHYDGNLMELLLALTALPEDVCGQTAPDLLALAEKVRRG